jgi:phage FluMu protein Com
MLYIYLHSFVIRTVYMQILESCQKCRGKGAIECPGCKVYNSFYKAIYTLYIIISKRINKVF